MTENRPEKSTNAPSAPPRKEIDNLLADLWQRHLPSLHERLDILDRTAAEAASGNLDEAARAQGQSVAHKLSGNQGMVGHHKAGDIASQIEHIFKAPTPETLPLIADLTQTLREALAPNL